jgi:hypothetical protein
MPVLVHMAGLGLFFHLRLKCAGPDTKGFASICLRFFVLSLCKKCQGIVEDARAVLTHARSYTQKTFFGPPSEALVTKSKTPKINFYRLTIQEPIFSVSNTEFEGGDNGHGHDDYCTRRQESEERRLALCSCGCNIRSPHVHCAVCRMCPVPCGYCIL